MQNVIFRLCHVLLNITFSDIIKREGMQLFSRRLPHLVETSLDFSFKASQNVGYAYINTLVRHSSLRSCFPYNIFQTRQYLITSIKSLKTGVNFVAVH